MNKTFYFAFFEKIYLLLPHIRKGKDYISIIYNNEYMAYKQGGILKDFLGQGGIVDQINPE